MGFVRVWLRVWVKAAEDNSKMAGRAAAWLVERFVLGFLLFGWVLVLLELVSAVLRTGWLA